MIIIQSPVKVSPKAMDEIRKIINSKKIPANYGLRIGIRDAGSPAVAYLLGFDQKNEGDNEYKADGIAVFIQKTAVTFLAGMTVDYYDGPEARGFTFLKS
jgi:iron-sulfur cluster assembly protein